MSDSTDTTKRADEHAWASESLPWFVNGTLGAELQPRFRAHLRRCQTCREELAMEQAIYDDMRSSSTTEYTPHASLQAVKARIERDKKQSARFAWLGNLSGSKAFTGFTLMAQAAAIALMAVVLIFRDPATSPVEGYETLSSSQPAAIRTHLQVVFADDMTGGQIVELLNSIDGHIVNGPSRGGMFDIQLGNQDVTDATLEQALARLNDNAGVVFATQRSGATD